ncbi:MAG: hypothetical protein DMG70_21410 [Acidobacteria bacterium]|nr:MAG: hypothetical protein DMG70_21410 [Acidobacteriota bacterium]
MVSNCANPACATPLRYFRDGRLYQFEVKSLEKSGANPAALEDEVTPKRKSRHIWHFWLCGRCSPKLTLKFDQLHGLKLIPANVRLTQLRKSG